MRVSSRGLALWCALAPALLAAAAGDEAPRTEPSFRRWLASKLATAGLSPPGGGFLRALSGDPPASSFAVEFGPGADWSCTTPETGGGYQACAKAGCSWCPLGSSSGVCLRTAQADLVNANAGANGHDELLHLRCYASDSDSETEAESEGEPPVFDASDAAFWDGAASCLPKGEEGCGGDDSCTWCTVDEPSLGFCLSRSLWDNLVVAQALEDFDEDLSEEDQIPLDGVVHCRFPQSTGTGDGDDSTSTPGAGAIHPGLFDRGCLWNAIESDRDEVDCLADRGQLCVVQANPFPGLLGTGAGNYCVSAAQHGATKWWIGVLRDAGWGDAASPSR